MIHRLWSRIVSRLLDGCGIVRPQHDYRRVGCVEIGEKYRYQYRIRCVRCGKERTWQSK